MLSKHHDSPPIHHGFTIETPRYFAAFLENPLEKRPFYRLLNSHLAAILSEKHS